MVADVTVVTASLPHRHQMLAECMEAVRNQTWQPKAHIIGIDYERIGPARMINKVIGEATTEWIAPIADDDLMHPTYIERLLTEAGDADMIYPWCEVIGTRNGWNPNSLFDPVRLRSANYIPATVLIKKSVWEELGGYPEIVCEDHGMWLKMLDAEKKIKCLPEILWTYRFHGRNVSDGIYQPWEV